MSELMTEHAAVDRLDDVRAIRIDRNLLDRLIAAVRGRHPGKSFGYLISDSELGEPTDFVLFEDNIRNEAGWRESFESYGDYFVLHRDAGFVATADEAWRVEKDLLRRGMYEVGVFHSHQRHPANFSRIDYDMHLARFDELWHMIISMRNPQQPVVRVFAPTAGGNREIPLEALPGPDAGAEPRPEHASAVPDAHERAELRSLLTLDRAGLPVCRDAPLVLAAVARVLGAGEPQLVDDLLTRGFLRGARTRFDELVAPGLRRIPATSFLMGSDPAAASNFCGEAPRHRVSLSPYRIAAMPVTAASYAAFDPERRRGGDAGRLPVVGVSWAEAAVFALWVGARLPSEAEWECACGAGADTEWCCATEADLGRYAWYCANSEGRLHPVGERSPNQLGLHDLHGNVWEWCRDTYDGSFYETAQATDPVNAPAWGTEALCAGRDKVTRGGCYQALPEMCRTRYRFHEPSDLRAADLGFRLACDDEAAMGGEPASDR